MNFVKLSKSSIYVEEEGAIYNLNKESNGTAYYKCSESKCLCRGKVLRSCEKFITTYTMVHFHQSHKKIAQQKIKFAELKDLVLNTKTSIHEICRTALRDMDFEMSGKFNWAKIRNNLQIIRRQQMPSCSNLEEMVNLLEFNEDVRQSYGMIRSHNFYQGTINGNMLIFANLEVINLLPNEITIFVDATFSVCPFNAYQLLIVSAEFAGSPRPIVFAVMPGKKQQLYEHFFHFFKNALLSIGNKTIKPVEVMMDFEKAMRNAIQKLFPGIIVRGCNFHFTQALRRKAIQIESLSRNIFHNSQHHQALKMFMRLSLLPLERVENGISQLKEYVSSIPEIEDDFQSFIIYFDKTWLQKYEIEDWCVSDATRRTNNNIEGLNSYIKKLMPRNPQPYTFLDCLLHLAYETSSAVSSAIEKPQTIKDRSKITKELKKCLLLLNNEEITEIEYLKRLAKI